MTKLAALALLAAFSMNAQAGGILDGIATVSGSLSAYVSEGGCMAQVSTYVLRQCQTQLNATVQALDNKGFTILLVTRCQAKPGSCILNNNPATTGFIISGSVNFVR